MKTECMHHTCAKERVEMCGLEVEVCSALRLLVAFLAPLTHAHMAQSAATLSRDFIAQMSPAQLAKYAAKLGIAGVSITADVVNGYLEPYRRSTLNELRDKVIARNLAPQRPKLGVTCLRLLVADDHSKRKVIGTTAVYVHDCDWIFRSYRSSCLLLGRGRQEATWCARSRRSSQAA